MSRARVPVPAVPALRRVRRALALIAAVMIGSSTLVVFGAAPPAAALTGHVQGTVFRDFNQNGVYNSTPVNGVTDAPMAGVTATAYNGAGVRSGRP